MSLKYLIFTITLFALCDVSKCDHIKIPKVDITECDDIPYKYECRQVGLYPHPYCCNKYFMCLEDDNRDIIKNPLELECTNGFDYDPLTTLCRKDPSTCSPAESCDKLMEQLPVSGNPYMAYFCFNVDIDVGVRKILPMAIYCAEGQQFHETTCRAANTGLDAENKCKSNGNFYLASDCKKFNKCSEVGEVPIVEECPPGQKFHAWKESCENFTC